MRAVLDAVVYLENKLRSVAQVQRAAKLTEENFRGIAALMLGEVRDVLAERGQQLVWDDKLIDHLVEKGYSVTYGARNLRRLIQKEIEDVVAEKIIECRGEDIKTISLSVADGKVSVEIGGQK